MGFIIAASSRAEARHEKAFLAGLFTRRRLTNAAITFLLLALFVALFYVEENWRGRREWERYRANLAARNIDLNWQRLTPPPVADEENFAATPFLAALFDFVPGTHTPRDLTAYNRVAGFAQKGEPYLEFRNPEKALLTVVPGEKIDLLPALRLLRGPSSRPGSAGIPAPLPADKPAQAAALLEALEEFHPVLDELQRASVRPSARFELKYTEDTPWAVSQPHHAVLKRVGMVLGLRALAKLALQDPQPAADDLDELIFVANSLAGEPFETSYWTRVAILEIGHQVLWEGLADHRWSDRQLSDFQARLGGIDLIRDASKPLILARAHGEYLFNLIHKSPAVVAGWRFGPGLGNALLPWILRWMPSGWMYLEQLSFHQRIDDFILRGFGGESKQVRPKTIDKAIDNHLALLRHCLLSGRLLHSQVGLAIHAALAQSRLNQALATCALERHRLANGDLPQTLESLAPQYLDSVPNDPIIGAPLRYHLLSGGPFSLYSVGWNEQDDHGKVVLLPHSKDPDLAQGDWTWPSSSFTAGQ